MNNQVPSVQQCVEGDRGISSSFFAIDFLGREKVCWIKRCFHPVFNLRI
jgi:hypothetical protein